MQSFHIGIGPLLLMKSQTSMNGWECQSIDIGQNENIKRISKSEKKEKRNINAVNFTSSKLHICQTCDLTLGFIRIVEIIYKQQL